jgi:hypothetical protein
MQTQFFSLRLLSDDELIARVNALAGTTREVSALLIAHLAEMETRKLHLPEGCSSMFTYCTRILKFSEHEAYGRIKAARVAARFPIVLDRLADGSLNMTAVVLLSPHLTTDNHRELFAEARHRTRQEVEKLVATLRPLPDVPTIIRKLPAPFVKQEVAESLFSENPGCRAGESTTGQEPTSIAASDENPFRESANKKTSTTTALPTPVVSPPAMPRVSVPARPTVILALAPNRYKLQVTISESTQQKLRQAQELIRHQIPDGNTAMIGPYASRVQ